MNITITINTDNDAFQGQDMLRPELAEVLTRARLALNKLVGQSALMPREAALLDSNGNTVGHVIVTE